MPFPDDYTPSPRVQELFDAGAAMVRAVDSGAPTREQDAARVRYQTLADALLADEDGA